MIRHVVLMEWKDGTTPEQIAEVSAGLAQLPERIPEIRRYDFGPDAGLAEGNASYAVVADFDDAAGYRAYRDAPVHQALITDVVRPLLRTRTAVQYGLG